MQPIAGSSSSGSSSLNRTTSSRSNIPHAQIVQSLVAGTLPEYVISHAGSSQYSGTGGGVSACGLAALNCARIVLGKELGGKRAAELLEEIMKPETTEEILRICTQWSSPAHLEVEDIYQSPFFHKSLRHESLDHGNPCLAQFTQMLQLLRTISVRAGRSSCTVITRPPEIIACFYIAGLRKDFFVIFDSHPRPNLHSSGAAFIFKGSLHNTATYLSKLLAFDNRLLRDRALQWEAQLLGNFSSNIFVAAQTSYSLEQWQHHALQASLEILQIRAECLELRSQNKRLIEENARLSQEVALLGSANEVTTPWFQWKPWNRGTGRSHPEDNTPIQREKSFTPRYSSERARPERPAIAESVSAYSTAPQSRDETWQNEITSGNAKPSTEPRGAELLDLEFAILQQKLFDEEDSRLRVERGRLAQDDVGNFQCGVCFEEYSTEFVARIAPCQHYYCRDCIRQHIATQVDARRYPILCPLCTADGRGRFPTFLDSTLIQDIGLSEAHYGVLEDLELAAISIMIHCRSCGRAPYVDKSEHTASQVLQCPFHDCGHMWCKQCSQSVTSMNSRHTCDGSAELNDLMRQKGWKHCPGCQTPAEKISGCNHMTCTSPGCHTHFCYVCGESIVQSIVRDDIQAAIHQHYNRCSLFEVIPD